MSEYVKNFGFVESKLDGTEFIFGSTKNNTIESYSYEEFLPKVIDQGMDNICVPCSLSAFINWRKNLEDGSKTDNKVDLFEIFNSRTNQDWEGMSFKDALKYLRHHGVKTDFGTAKIGTYAMVKNALDLRNALIENGPCVAGMPVYSDSEDFWKKRIGQSLLGFHAIAIVGYDLDGFIIRNSWGKYYGNKGYAKVKLEDFNKFKEIWTITD